MDINAPEALRDTVQTGYDQSKALIAKWHKQGRNLYAITPRFAGTSSREQLDMAGALWREHEDAASSRPHRRKQGRGRLDAEAVSGAARLSRSIYDHAGLTGRRAVLAHGIHLDEDALLPLPRQRHPASGALPDIEPVSRQRPVSRMRDAKDPRGRSMSAWEPISVPAPASRCWPRWARATRCPSSTARRSRRSRPFSWQPWAGRGRSISMTGSAHSARQRGRFRGARSQGNADPQVPGGAFPRRSRKPCSC